MAGLRRSRRLSLLEDPGFDRQVARLLEEQRQQLPADADLDAAARVTDADIDVAEQLWNEAQRLAGTGLDGLLSAREAAD